MKLVRMISNPLSQLWGDMSKKKKMQLVFPHPIRGRFLLSCTLLWSLTNRVVWLFIRGNNVAIGDPREHNEFVSEACEPPHFVGFQPCETYDQYLTFCYLAD